MNRNEYDIFICHRRDDAAELSVATHAYFNRNGLRTFCDLVDDPQYNLGSQIFDIIRATPTFLFIASDGALARTFKTDTWVRKELDCALAASRRIVTVRVCTSEGPVQHSISTGVEKAVNSPKVVLQPGTPSEAALRTILSATVVARPLVLSDVISEINLRKCDLNELLCGISNASIGEYEPVDLIIEALFSGQSLGSQMSGQQLLDGATKLKSFEAELMVRRAVTVQILRHLSRDLHNGLPNISDVRPLWPLLHSTFCEEGPTLRAVRSAQGFYTIPLFSIVQQGRIRELLRLHIWHCGAPKTTNGYERSSSPESRRSEDRDQSQLLSIHSHQPYARSWVLSGELCNRVFAVTRGSNDDESSYPHALFAVNWDGQRQYNLHHEMSCIANTGKLVGASFECSAVIHAGETYSVPAGEFHETKVEMRSGLHSLTATLFFFDASQGWVDDAAVLGPSSVDASACHRAPFDPQIMIADLDSCLNEKPSLPGQNDND